MKKEKFSPPTRFNLWSLATENQCANNELRWHLTLFGLPRRIKLHLWRHNYLGLLRRVSVYFWFQPKCCHFSLALNLDFASLLCWISDREKIFSGTENWSIHIYVTEGSASSRGSGCFALSYFPCSYQN